MIDHLTIIGVGLIGGSVAKALRSENAVGHVTGFGRRERTLQRAQALGVIDSWSLDLDVAVERAEVVILTSPVNSIASIFHELKPCLGEATVVTDAGSVKGSIVDAAVRGLGDKIVNFVPGHPKAGKEQSGQFQHWRPQYMEAVIAYNRSLDQPIYADANSALRVTFGRVQGNEPKDGLVNLPFTTLEGILGKDTGLDPFNAPQKQLNLIRSGEYGAYELPSLGSVPVNFLADLDITGGNSGTAAMNSKAQLVGLLFDGVYESIIGDWDFDQAKNRAIAVDSRYMLWVMEYMDNAANLLEEMTIVD